MMTIDTVTPLVLPGAAAQCRLRRPSANARLARLLLSAGPLEPPFRPDWGDYTLAVAHPVSSLILLGLTADAGATLTVNGCVLASGLSSPALPLAVGRNRFSLQVCAEDGRLRDYRIDVTRAAAPLPAIDDPVLLVLPASALPPHLLAALQPRTATLPAEPR